MLIRSISIIKYLFLFSIILLNAPIILAQSGATTGAIIGTISDEQMAVISGVTITARHLETNFIRTVQSDEKGLYQLPRLPPGKYEIQTTKPDFSTKSETITISIGATVLIDFTLFPTSTAEVVIVSADNVKEEKTESSIFINQQKISTLPTSRRNFLDFAILSPRVLIDRTPAKGLSSGSGLSINGQIGRFNNITIDGLDNNDSGTGSVRSTFAQDAVREFQVVSDGFSAEFGRALAGVVNIVTQSGSNDYHSSLFFFHRDDGFSARNPFFAQKNPFTQYQFGTVFGGPIKKDKLFFFGSLERLTSKNSIFVPIPKSFVDSVRRQGFSIDTGIIPFSIANISALFRIDGKLSTNNTFWTRYNGGFSYNGQFEPNIGSGGNFVSDRNGGIQRLNDNSLAFSNSYINANLNLVNETRFLFGRRDQKVLPVSSESYGTIDGGPSFGNDLTLPQPRLEYIYQIVNNSTLIKKQHQIKFGIDLQYIKLPKDGSKVVSFFNGAYSFTNLDFADLFQQSGLPKVTAFQAFDPSLRTTEQRAFLTFAASILPSLIPGFPKNLPLANTSLPLFFGQGFGDPTTELTAKFFSSFIQDDFKPLPNLLIKAGLRYDLNRVSFIPNNNGNFSPRLGISYVPFQKKVPNLRLNASYGLFFGAPFTGPAFQSHLYESGQYRLLVLVPPFSVIPYLLPNHNFADKSKLPDNVPYVRQYAIEYQYQPDARNSYSQQTSLGIGYRANNQINFSINYNFLRGIKLFSRREINPVVRPIPGDLLGGFVRGRVDTNRGSVLEFENLADSYFHGVTFSVDYKLSKKLDLLANYTYSKSIDNINGAFTNEVTEDANDSLKPGLERGLSTVDLRSRFIFSGIWQMPDAKNKILKDFQLATIISLNSGSPYNLRAGKDLNMNDSIGDRPLDIGRNTGITAGFANIDLRLERIFSFQDKYKLQTIFEVFNLFNRVNIDPDGARRTFPPDEKGNFNLPAKQGSRFGLPKENYFRAFPARQLQFGIRLSF